MRILRRFAVVSAVAGTVIVLGAGPAFAFHCQQVSKNPDAGQVAEKTPTGQGGGRSWNSGATGGFDGDTFARNFLVNAGCGGSGGTDLEDGCLAGVVNPGELYKEFGIAGNGD